MLLRHSARQAWQWLSAGPGARGQRYYDWAALISLAAPRPDDPRRAGLAEVVTMRRRNEATHREGDEEDLVPRDDRRVHLARHAAWLAPASVDELTNPIVEIC